MGDIIGSDIYPWVGLSTGTKPSKGIRGQKAIEYDTGSVFQWLGDELGNGSWVQILAGGNSNVVLADQVTRPIIAKFNQVQNSTTLAAAASKGDTTIQVTSATGFVDGRYIILFNPTSKNFVFCEQVGAASGTTITLDCPLDNDYAAGTFVDAATTNLGVNGSSTPQTFGLRGTGAPPGVDIKADITRIIFKCIAATAVDLTKFGDLAKLTRGLLLRRRDGTFLNIFNVKDNGEIAGIAYDWNPEASTNPVQGVDGFYARLTFAGQNKIGVAIRLPLGEDLEFIVQDNLSGLTLLEVVAEGHIVSE
jgi:hypothetical protein